MKERISQKMLDFRIEWLNKALNRPTVPWSRENGRNKAAIGHFHLDHCLGGWQINEMINENGGVCCPFGSYRHSARETLDILEAALKGIELGKKSQVPVLELAEATIERLQRHAPGSANGTLDVLRKARA